MNRKRQERVSRRRRVLEGKKRRKRRERLRVLREGRRLKPLAFCPFCNPEGNQYPLFPRRKNG